MTVEPLYSQIGKSKSLKCLYVPTVSSLLLDRFLIDKAEYASSLIKPILEVSCPIRKLIGRKTSSKDGTGEWIEGRLVAPNVWFSYLSWYSKSFFVLVMDFSLCFLMYVVSIISIRTTV